MELRRQAAATTGLTFVLLLVGVYTKEVGADLACGMNWPLCDGAVFGLFPANLPSFFEWFHRLLALVVGVLIIYTVYRLYRERGGRSRVTRAAVVALVLLPVQAGLGALTVLKSQLLGEVHVLLEGLISVAHYGTGVALFTALVAATLWAYEGADGVGTGTGRG
ncbi:MAG: COX15/CtaA family protein [Halobacteriales archaeon]